MVYGFTFEIPEEYNTMPLLKMKTCYGYKGEIKANPNIEDCLFSIVLDGYKPPVTAANFRDLVQRDFCDGMETHRATIYTIVFGGHSILSLSSSFHAPPVLSSLNTVAAATIFVFICAFSSFPLPLHPPLSPIASLVFAGLLRTSSFPAFSSCSAPLCRSLLCPPSSTACVCPSEALYLRIHLPRFRPATAGASPCHGGSYCGPLASPCKGSIRCFACRLELLRSPSVHERNLRPSIVGSSFCSLFCLLRSYEFLRNLLMRQDIDGLLASLLPVPAYGI